MGHLKPIYHRSYALVIGVDSYADPRLVTLGEAEADAEGVAKVLRSEPHNFEVRLLCGPEATRETILGELYRLRQTDVNDRILVYFAGHGFTRRDRIGIDRGYIAPFDTDLERDYTAIEITDITSLRGFAPAKHIAFIFDACFSGQALGLTRSAAANKFMTRRAYQVISAGAGDQTVSDYNSMTDLLIGALNGEGPNSRSLYTLSDLGLYLRQTMARDSNHTQIPQFGHLTGSEGGEFIFFTETAIRLPSEVESALYARNEYVRRGAVAALIAMAKSGEEEKVQLAQEWLQRLSVSDLDPGVREAARSYFEEQEARSTGDREKLHMAMRVQKQTEGVLDDPERLKLPGLEDVARVHKRMKTKQDETFLTKRVQSLEETRQHVPSYRRPTEHSRPTKMMAPPTRRIEPVPDEVEEDEKSGGLRNFMTRLGLLG